MAAASGMVQAVNVLREQHKLGPARGEVFFHLGQGSVAGVGPGLRHQFALGLWVFAALRRDADQLNADQALKAFTNLQAGGASFAIDENFLHCEL